MADRQLSSKVPRARNRSAKEGSRGSRPRQSGDHDDAYGVPVPEGLHEAIESERDNLAKAESVLGCLVLSMEGETLSASAPYYPDVAQIAREMVRRSINGLDSLMIQRRLQRNRVRDEPQHGCYCGALESAVLH